jgi:LytS/YehU family sensor histidine kinase
MELKFLKSQINPHVLFNNLNTIYSYALEKPNETPELILRLSDNLKHVLYESNAEKISLNKEIQFIDNYMTFQELRTEGVNTLIYSKSIENENSQIAPLLLITIIENAFKHSSLNSEISVSIVEENSVLTCVCENDFIQKDSDLEHYKIGLENLEKRLQLLYKDKYDFTITQNQKFKVVLKLNLI